MNDDKIARFWDIFIEKTKRYGIKDKAVRWHVRHAERYIKAHEGIRLSAHTPQHVEDYLAQMARVPQLQDWQYKQIIKSLQILFVDMVQAEWASTFPWQDRIDDASALSPDHATIARDTGARVKKQLAENTANASSLFAKVSKQFPQQFERLMVEIRMRQYSIRTEKAYAEWLTRYIAFHAMQDPATLEPSHIGRFLEHLVVNRNVSSSTQSQALNALIFFYKQVLGREIDDIGIYRHSKKPRKLPVVLTRDEVTRVLQAIDNPERRLMANLLYGCGMRLMECVRLCVLDVDFGYQQILVRNTKGGKDRVVPLPDKLLDPLQAQIEKVRQMHQDDLARGFGSVFLPDALARKYPNAPKEFRWHPVRG